MTHEVSLDLPGLWLLGPSAIAQWAARFIDSHLALLRPSLDLDPELGPDPDLALLRHRRGPAPPPLCSHSDPSPPTSLLAGADSERTRLSAYLAAPWHSWAGESGRHVDGHRTRGLNP